MDIFFITLYVLSVQFGWASSLVSAPITLSSPVTVSAITLWGVIRAAAWSVWCAWGAVYVVRILFPLGVFLIGQEKARYKTKEWAQKTVMGTVAGSILAWLLSLTVR